MPDDKYEQEADRVADQVMRMPEPRLQRQPMDTEEPKPPRPPEAPRPQLIIEAVPVEEDIVPGRGFGGNVANHVKEHMDTDRIADRDVGLGHVVEAADEHIEEHLEEVFDHDVGHLAHADPIETSVAEGTDAPSWEGKKAEDSTADVIRKMLQSPDDIRNVFIISEILKRPDI